ncbi:hypothetical protein KIL84_004954 [Mauremys mutica]|uniref:Uncharacterized protein n=1 Tax=Mauremys mutica TaxID=74926 RepID=A0A9D3WNB6_9SAUR|nr:hypothetical protein KIL84_004954 [Mauremys mutica]
MKGIIYRGTMNEEQFVNIDLNDDNVCSVCKLGTEKETLSFCHVCFELNIEGVEEELILIATWTEYLFSVIQLD